MGIRLISSTGTEIQFSNITWCYVLNLGEHYGWKPFGTKKPKGYGFFSKWSGIYDSSEGQKVISSDASNLCNALRMAIDDKDFISVSEQLKIKIQEVLEQSIGNKLGYEILTDMNTGYLKEVVDFIEHGEFTIT